MIDIISTKEYVMRKCILKCALICYLLFLPMIATAKLVFVSEVDGKRGIYVMDDNGDNRILLTDVLHPSFPRWSPDGKQIVFQRNVKDDLLSPLHIFLMNSDGTNVRQLTPPPPIDGWDSHPSFSPDGKSVVFARYERDEDEHKDSINVIDIASGQVKQITNLKVQLPFFSPDGKEILCVSIEGAAAGGGNFYIMDVNGNRVRELLKPAVQNVGVAVSREKARWSPDGKHIVYTESHFGRKWVGNVLHQIPKGFYYIICDRNGQLVKRLKIPNNLRAQGIDWMDNGKAIVFCAYAIKLEKLPLDGEIDALPWHIYKYNILSKKMTRLTNHHAQNYHIDWIDDDVLPVSPQGKKKVTWGTVKQQDSE